MSWIEALILGLIQGLTEFLPVSSSGHLEIGNALLGIENSDNLLFAVVVHAATASSTIVVFRSEIIKVFQGLFKPPMNDSWVFAIKIVISMLPVLVVGLMFKDQIEALFTGNIVWVGSMLIFTSFLLLASHFSKTGEKEVTYLGSLVIGIAQAFAVLPGISRSGATIATGILLGFDKIKVTQFSFLMVLVPILGASLLELKDYLEAPATSQSISATPLVVGFFAALISGYIACRWMLSIVRKGKLTYFALYCFILGVAAIVFS